MDRVGDDLAGFSIDYDSTASVVSVRGWGFWSPEVATNFGIRVCEACTNRPKGTRLVLELTALKPMREEGQRSFTSLLAVLSNLRVAATVVATGNHLTKLQLMRLGGAVPASKTTVQFV